MSFKSDRQIKHNFIKNIVCVNKILRNLFNLRLPSAKKLIMLRSGAQGQMELNVLANINCITVDSMLEIQKELEPYDIVSLVFLLYDVPDTALQRLITYQRVSREVTNDNLNLLYEWALYAQSKPTWRYEFLEALTICRLFSIIRKLGFNVESAKQHYDPSNIHVNVYIHSVKKLLYKLSENITSTNLIKLKQTLISYDIDATEHEYCEMIFLELICKKFIILNYPSKEGVLSTTKKTQLEKLARIIESYHDLQYFATQLREVEMKLNCENTLHIPSVTSSPNTSKAKVDDGESKYGHIYAEDLQEVFQMFNQMNLEDVPKKNFKSDKIFLNDNSYPIINPKRVGICCIVNQEKFHPSRNSIEVEHQPNKLSDRLGSTKDQFYLEKIMQDLNYVVKIGTNLKYKEIFEFIKECINFTNQEDSIFVLCILSHGVRDHIFSSDSLKVKVDDIQNMLDSDEALHLRGKPKVLIIQACRVDETPDVPRPRLVADSATTSYYLRKSHFLVYWATAPEYEAFRDERMGSIFIQTLCYVIKKKAQVDQLCDICTLVTDIVTSFCTKNQHVQVPIFESTLRKKLFLCNPSECKPDKRDISKS